MQAQQLNRRLCATSPASRRTPLGKANLGLDRDTSLVMPIETDYEPNRHGKITAAL